MHDIFSNLGFVFDNFENIIICFNISIHNKKAIQFYMQTVKSQYNFILKNSIFSLILYN